MNTPADYAKNKEAYESDCLAKMPAIRDIYDRYWERCRQADAMDFDDLLFYTFCYFITIPKCWQGIRSYFVMSLLMSIKTQIMRSTAYCVN